MVALISHLGPCSRPFMVSDPMAPISKKPSKPWHLPSCDLPCRKEIVGNRMGPKKSARTLLQPMVATPDSGACSTGYTL
jgi:hypothetical protein